MSGNPVSANSPLFPDKTDNVDTPPPPWVPLTKHDPPSKTPPPKSIRFWDGTERTIRYWNQVLVSTAEKLYVKGKLQYTDTPIQLWTDGWNSIHSEPMHPNGTEWRKPLKPIGNPPLFVNVNLNAKDCRDGAIRLLKKYDVDPSKVCLLPGE